MRPVLHLIWPDTRNHGLAEPYYKRSTDGGKTWTEEVRLSPGTDLFRIGTAVSGSAVHVVWFNRHYLEKVPAGDQTWTWTWGEVYYCRSTDGGVTWEKAIRLTQPDSTACRPVVAASGRYVHVAWLDNRDAKQKPGWDWEIYYKRSTDGGATWGPDVRMSHNEWHSRHPQIMTGGGDRVCCVWEDGAIWDGKTSSGWSGDGAPVCRRVRRQRPDLEAATADNNRELPPRPGDARQELRGRFAPVRRLDRCGRRGEAQTDSSRGGLLHHVNRRRADVVIAPSGWRAGCLVSGLLTRWRVMNQGPLPC